MNKSDKKESFGNVLRRLRKKKGVSIKNLSSELDINYSYISKIENEKSFPSEEFIYRLSRFFEYDNEELLMRAGKIPNDIASILKNHPKEAAALLRKKFESNE